MLGVLALPKMLAMGRRQGANTAPYQKGIHFSHGLPGYTLSIVIILPQFLTEAEWLSVFTPSTVKLQYLIAFLPRKGCHRDLFR